MVLILFAFLSGKLCQSDLDSRALDALKEFPIDGALAVLTQFTESNLEHVSNKSAYLCGVMKTYRQKIRGQVNSVQEIIKHLGSMFFVVNKLKK